MTTCERFWAKVDRGSPDECWNWRGATAGRPGEDYGQFRLEGQVVPAHRAAWLLERGAIVAGLVIDHLCRNHLCVNVAHLEVVSQRTNILRGDGACARRYRKARGLPEMTGAVLGGAA